MKFEGRTKTERRIGTSFSEQVGHRLAQHSFRNLAHCCGNAQVHTAAIAKKWYTDHSIQLLQHQPYSPDLAIADSFFFRRVTAELASLSLDEGSLKNIWEEVIRPFPPMSYPPPSGGGLGAASSVSEYVEKR
jgi:hypothetical protein